ncbi:hypothetical protein MLD38_015135 [Melastoma candidum]|uniref:Uncharacterized protein n=1 Tax=Melastoma candidum TaxID=119954 RepID=A0ACB9RGB1_9MYRT|nr:hypothetical protein MLD38_015135 [Melastoma candidum]
MYSSTLNWINRTEGVASFYRRAASSTFRSTGSAAILVLYRKFITRIDWYEK